MHSSQSAATLFATVAPPRRPARFGGESTREWRRTTEPWRRPRRPWRPTIKGGSKSTTQPKAWLPTGTTTGWRRGTARSSSNTPR